MKKQLEQAKKYFDIMAPLYDNATSIKNTWNPPSFIYQNIKELISDNSTILDIGVGTGQSIDKIYNNKQFKKLYGVDISQKMIFECQKKYPKMITQQISDISDILNLEDKKFDLIICSGLIEFVDDIKLFFETVSTILSKKGYFVFTYEPIIEFHSYQQYKSSLTVPQKNSSLFIDNFYTYRYHPLEIKDYLYKHKLTIISDLEFIAYKKGDEKIIYHLLVTTSL